MFLIILQSFRFQLIFAEFRSLYRCAIDQPQVIREHVSNSIAKSRKLVCYLLHFYNYDTMMCNVWHIFRESVVDYYSYYSKSPSG